MNLQAHHIKRVAASLLAAAGAATSVSAGLILPQTPTDASYRIVAYTGDAAPGGGVWTGFGNPTISETGRVAFVGHVQGLFEQSGIWSEGHSGAGNLQPVVREFQSVPSLTPMTYGEFHSSFHTPVMSDSGDIAFGAPLVGDALNNDTDTGVFRHIGGQLEVVALPFWPAPGGGLYGSISNLPAMNNVGQVAFHARLIGGGVNAANDSGTYRDGAGPTELIFREGDPIAGIPGGFMSSILSALVTINDNGVISLQHWYNDNGQGRWSVWRAEPGGMSILDLVAREDDASPAGPVYGAGLFGLGQVSFNNAGDAHFAQIADFGTPNQTGQWLHRVGSESAVAHWGMAGPFLSVFRNVDPFTGDINGDGRVVFQSSIDAAGLQNGDSGLFYRDGDGPAHIVAVAGQDAPGMPVGVQYDHGSNFSTATVNSEGRIAYTARMTGPGITDDNDVAMWVSRGAGDSDLVLYEGQVMFVGGQLRTVQSFNHRQGAGPESGRRASFNDNNQVSLRVNFTDDSSAIIVATVAALCAGDLNGDGIVDGADLATLLALWGACGDEFCAADINLDGQVDGADLASLLAVWGPCP